MESPIHNTRMGSRFNGAVCQPLNRRYEGRGGQRECSWLGMFLAMPAAASQQGPQVDHSENLYRRVGLDGDADDCAIVNQTSPNNERRAT
jgi:hypothetical protein